MKIIIKTLLFVVFFHIFFSTLDNISKVSEQRIQEEKNFVENERKRSREDCEKQAEKLYYKKSKWEKEQEIMASGSCAEEQKKIDLLREEKDYIFDVDRKLENMRTILYRLDKAEEAKQRCIDLTIEANKNVEKILRAGYIRSCSDSYLSAARSWRDLNRKYSSTIIRQIVSGLYVTTANILDDMIGGIIDTITLHENQFNKYGVTHADIRIFNDLLIKMDLHYIWGFGAYDLFDKDGNGWRIKLLDDDLFRILANIFVCIVFICLAIRIFSFNFRDGIFEIIRGKK